MSDGVAGRPDHAMSPDSAELVDMLDERLSEQVQRFHRGLAAGSVRLWAGRTATGLPEILPAVLGRRRDRARHLLAHSFGIDPGLYGEADETAQTAAYRAVLWLARHAPRHPVRVRVDAHGLVRATFELPGEVVADCCTGHCRAAAGAESVVTARSLAEAVHGGEPATVDGADLLPELDLDGLVPSALTAPGPVDTAAGAERVLLVNPSALDLCHLILPRPDPAFDWAIPLAAWSTPAWGGQGMPVDVLLALPAWEALGWLDPFAAGTGRAEEHLVAVVGDTRVRLVGSAAAVDLPRPR